MIGVGAEILRCCTRTIQYCKSTSSLLFEYCTDFCRPLSQGQSYCTVLVRSTYSDGGLQQTRYKLQVIGIASPRGTASNTTLELL